MMENYKIRVEDLKIELSGKEILHGVDLHIKEGSFVGVIGPNGSGKSTLLKTIYRILKPKSGAIFLNNKDIKDIDYKESAREMAVVSQANQVNFDFTVFDMVMMGRSPYKKPLDSDTVEDIEIAYDSLKKVGMYDYRDRIFTSLSGGEQQRIILARALTQNTSCYILDEPTNHLDIKYQLEILDLVRSLDVTSVVALHDLNLAAMYCDYIYVMKDGFILDEGKPSDLLTEEFIRKVYGVESRVLKDEESNRIHIIYERAI